jgi:hypothetical protein
MIRAAPMSGIGRIALLSATALLFAAAAEAETRTVRIGSIAITFEDTRWRVSSESAIPDDSDMAEPDAEVRSPRFLILRCMVAPACVNEPMLWVSAIPIADETESEGPSSDTLPGLGFSRPELPPLPIRDPSGLVLYKSVAHSNCRAGTPPMYRATAIYDGVRYVLSSGWAYGCGGSWGVPRAMFDELVAGVSLARR